MGHSIHERSAREKISSDQVAHVLNDEVSRKYIQSLKRYVRISFWPRHTY
jgi:pre-mRNA-splicing factor 18